MLNNQNEGRDSLIYPKELAAALQRSLRWAQKVFVNVRYILGKEKYQLVTLREVADYLGIPAAMLRSDW